MNGYRFLKRPDVTKAFGAVRALTDASLEVYSGEIVALLGANGAGKSTLVKILTGALRPDRGNVRIRGEELKVASPTDARQSGLIPVYQESSMIPDLTVADNLRLTNTAAEPFRHWLGELGIGDLGLDEQAGGLPLATLRILDLARALANEPVVLLLDEMTAALPTDLVQKVLEVVRSQKQRDCGIIFISHRFVEIAAVCDRASVLRDGRTVGSLEVEEGIEDRIVEMMLGGSIASAVAAQRTKAARSRKADPPRLSAKGLSAGAKLAEVSFELHHGEVLGVVALEGQGQDELFEVLSGFERPNGGVIEVEGTPVSFRHPADAIEAGLAYVPGDRAAALLMQRSVHENIALPFSARASAWGADIEATRGPKGRRGDRSTPDRYPGAGRGSPPVGRQSAKGYDRSLDRDEREDASSLRSDARNRYPHEAADLSPDAGIRGAGSVRALLYFGAGGGSARLRSGVRYFQRSNRRYDQRERRR